MASKLTPSRIARLIASQMWPDVQRQERIAPGVYWFSCAGHGGCVAVRGVADIDDQAWHLANEYRMTAAVAYEHGKLKSSLRYNGAQVRAFEGSVEVWIGEEDCDWATIYQAHNDIERLIRVSVAKGMTLDADYVAASCKQWNPDFYTALTGETVTADESRVIGRREFEAEHADRYVAVSASGSWHDEVPAGMVGVVATLGGSNTPDAYAAAQRFLVSKADYDTAGPFGYVVKDTDQPWECAETRQTKQVHAGTPEGDALLSQLQGGQ
jgi:hypothetical protein